MTEEANEGHPGTFDRDITAGMIVKVLVALRTDRESTVFQPLEAVVESCRYFAMHASHVVVRLAQNHPAYEQARGLGLTLVGELCDIEVSEGEDFIIEYQLTEEEWEELVNDISMNGDMSHVVENKRKKRRSDTLLLLEDSFADPGVAARVLHTAPGIQTRKKHYPVCKKKLKASPPSKASA